MQRDDGSFTLITDRDVLRASPQDILLINCKMPRQSAFERPILRPVLNSHFIFFTSPGFQAFVSAASVGP